VWYHLTMLSPPTPAKRRWRRRLTVIAALLLLGALGLYLLVLALLPSAIVYAPNAKRTIDPAEDPGPGQLRALGVSRALRVEVGPPAASLSCWLVDPPSRPAPAGTVLVLHGIRDSKRSVVGFGRALARRGYRAVVVDLRGHGRSSGRWLTYGVVESRDLSQLLDALQARDLLHRPVGAVGFSYGGAAALQLAARDARVTAVATVATFSALHEVVPLYVRRMVPLLGRLVSRGQIDRALERAGQLAAFDPRQASPLRAVGRTRAALLLVHGAEDRNIPASHARALHAAADRSELVLIPGADHDSVMGHPRVGQAIQAHLARHLR
jgi:pimeloyl-ACP methyl ester carboxylesterase